MTEKNYALLIDADNISPKYVKAILSELLKYGSITYKRIYADWTNHHNSGWKDKLLANSISPIQQFSYTMGKNSTDSAMIIDAMDILYTGNVDGFCIVSSDSDFTKLASRLRESGVHVIGMGEKKTPIAFRKACDVFTNLNLLLEDNAQGKETTVRENQDAEKSSYYREKHQDYSRQEKQENIYNTEKADMQEKQDTIVDKKEIEDAILLILTENANNDRTTTLGEVGNRLVKIYPDFDVRSYGYSLLSKFLQEFTRIRLIKENMNYTVALAESRTRREMVEQQIIDIVKKENLEEGMELGYLGRLIRDNMENFDIREFGYAHFKNFVKDIEGLEMREYETRWRIFCADEKPDAGN